MKKSDIMLMITSILLLGAALAYGGERDWCNECTDIGNGLVSCTTVGCGDVPDALAAKAPAPVRTATPGERQERMAFNQMAERNRLVNLLFGGGKVAKGCTFELLDPSKPYVASNLGLYCPGKLTFCEAVTADCD